MVSIRRPGQAALASFCALAVTVAVPASAGSYEAASAQTIEAPLLVPATFTAPPTILQADARPLLTDDRVIAPTPAAAAAADDALTPELECMAKVVVHESRGQPRSGQLAVAQTIVNRRNSGRFASSICGVVHQPGQYFDTTSYDPRRDTQDWTTAVAVAREALAGATPDVVPGALFFRAAASRASGFFRTRARIASIGGHIFYR